MKAVALAAALAVYVGCATSPAGKTADVAAENPHATGYGIDWYGGTVDQAFESAKASGKPIFLYWGAVWCPPCNELKSQVFSRKQFPELMRRVIPVYLDGDSNAAQQWAEKLKVSGYPTLLILSSQGKEIVRIAESVNFAEFKEVFDAALVANQPLDQILAQAMQGKGSDEQWQVLAYFNWDASASLKTKPIEMIAARKKLVAVIPAKLSDERAILASRLIESAVAIGSDPKADKGLKKMAEEVRIEGDRYLDMIFATPATISASRAFINYSTKDVLKWLYPDRDDKRGLARMDQWIDAARKIRFHGDMSFDTKLWSFQPEIEVAQMKYPTQDLPTSLVDDVKQMVEAGDKDSRTSFERHAFISGAAEMLRLVGDGKGAKALLEKEVGLTDTPWYYYSELSALAEKLGNKKEALDYSEKARRSSKGSATRVQWTTSDLLANTRLESTDQEERIAAILVDYYDTVFALSDGFLGRNGARAERVAKEMTKWAQKPRVKPVITKFARQCRDAPATSQAACKKHFASYISLPLGG